LVVEYWDLDPGFVKMRWAGTELFEARGFGCGQGLALFVDGWGHFLLGLYMGL
jgi:hypothetical protein